MKWLHCSHRSAAALMAAPETRAETCVLGCLFRTTKVLRQSRLGQGNFPSSGINDDVSRRSAAAVMTGRHCLPLSVDYLQK
jgi:hypothetical protein